MDIVSKITGSSLTAAEFNEIPDELEQVITDSGQTPSSGDLTQVSKGITNLVGNGDYYTDSGTADAKVLSVISPNQSPTAYRTGMKIRFSVNTTNTGSCTINVATLGNKALKSSAGDALVAGDLVASEDVEAFYDGTDFLLKDTVVRILEIKESAAPANNRLYQMIASTEQFILRLANDARDSFTSFMEVDRTDNVVDTINFKATNLQHNGGNIHAEFAASNWTIRTGSRLYLRAVAYGDGLFVAVGDDRDVMTSPDGITWTTRTGVFSNWGSIAYGNGVFVVAAGGPTPHSGIMTSPDGITWTSRTAAAANDWFSVAYGNGLFVAVSTSGTGDRVMTSPDGITWTSRTSAADNSWLSVAYGDGLFVAVSSTGTGNRVMTSPDGITWTIRTSAADNVWRSVTYGDGLFVAVADSGTGNRVMTSPDGITWTSRTSAADHDWLSVTYGDGLFVAVADTGARDNVMTSTDGITWTSRVNTANYPWRSVTYGDGLFVAVTWSSVDYDTVMTSLRTK